MPLFSNTSGINIHGGNFYEIGGDMHLENNQQLVTRDSQALYYPWAALEASQSSVQRPSTGQHRWCGGHSLAGVIRNSRQTGTASGRPVPYNASFRYQNGSERCSLPPFYNQPNSRPDDYNPTAPLSHLRNVNGPGAEVGSNNGVFNSYPAPWSGDTHGPETGTNIHGGTFIGGNVNNGETGLHILHREVSESLEAMHDSRDSDTQPKCHPETRTKMLEKLYSWCIRSEGPDGSDETVDSHSDMDTPFIEDTMERLPVLWLHGPAGAGKSALMRTLAERLATSGHLGGSFFFKRGHPTRGNAQKLFATLAYQLAFNIPQMKARISNIMAEIPYVVAKSMDVQLQKLVIEPCRQLGIAQPITIIIDGLDECKEPGLQQVLRCIGNSTRHEQDSSPLLFLIASRPEPHIREIFQGSFFHGFPHSFNVEQSLEDVRKYLTDEFARIHREHHQTMGGISSPWPSEEVLEYLVDKSSGYFIYAATVIKFVDDRNFRPTDQLAALHDASHVLESPFSTLDRLYTQILSTVPARYLLLPILRALEFFEFRLNTGGIEQVLELKPGDVQLILRGLHSVLDVPNPENDNERWEWISVHHASFRDFLSDPSRSGEFYVGGPQHQVALGKLMLKALSYIYDNREITHAERVAFEECLQEAISKIPPLQEMIPLIRLISPDFFFYYRCYSPGKILSLLEGIGNPPEDLVQLWKDYDFMRDVDLIISQALESPPPGNANSGLSKDFQQLYHCARRPRILQSYILGQCMDERLSLLRIHFLLDISWADLRAAICPLEHIIDSEEVSELLWFVAEHLSPQVAISQLLLELAQGCIRQIKNNTPHGLRHLLLDVWGCFIRASPLSLQLLQDIRQISFDTTDLKRNPAENYHNTLQWLKAFPDPPQDVIEAWEQYLMVSSKLHHDEHPYDPQYDLEAQWREWQAHKEMWFPHLRFRQNSWRGTPQIVRPIVEY